MGDKAEPERKTFEMVIALAIVVASFMYIYDALTRYTKVDVLLAVLVFGAGLIYLFSSIWRK
jgi:hypothetical protein